MPRRIGRCHQVANGIRRMPGLVSFSAWHSRLVPARTAQILNAVPGSVDQTWHSDNRSRGLSIIVP